jgi:hypothetical protein
MFSRKCAKAQRKTQENLCAFAPLREKLSQKLSGQTIYLPPSHSEVPVLPEPANPTLL